MTDPMPPDAGSPDELSPDELAVVNALVRSDAVWAEPPADLEDAVVAAIRAEATSSPRVGAAPPTGASTRLRWLAAVAAIAVAFGLGAVLFADDGRGDGPPSDEFALAGTDLAPDVAGTVDIAELGNGVRIILTVTDLPPAPEGQFYEAWLRNPDEGVSAGTFHMRRGEGSIELWAGVLTDGYPIFAVSLEDEDGEARSSGRVVLTADLAD